MPAFVHSSSSLLSSGLRPPNPVVSTVSPLLRNTPQRRHFSPLHSASPGPRATATPDTNPDRSPSTKSISPSPAPTPVTTRVTFTETAPTPWFSVPWSPPTTSRTYTLSPDGTKSASSTSTSTKLSSKTPSISDADASTAVKLLQRVARPLLPSGFPGTVGATYGSWALWHVGRHVFRNAYYVLGTTSLLVSLGMDQSRALAVSAALKWVLKDGLAMGTKLVLSTSLARIVDASPKRCRFAGDLLMTQAALVEIASLAAPQLFLLFGSLAALLRDAGGAVSGPAYRVFLDAFANINIQNTDKDGDGRKGDGQAVKIRRQSRKTASRGNIGDVSSRGEAQVVVGNLLGLSLGVFITSVLNHMQAAPNETMSLFGIELNGRLFPTVCAWGVLASAHMWCTYNAVRSVRLNTLNLQRLDLILSYAEQHRSGGNSSGSDDGDARPLEVPSVDDVNVRERFVPALWDRDSNGLSPIMRQVEVGGSLEAFVAGEPDASHREGLMQKAARATMLSKSDEQQQRSRGVLVLRRFTDGKVGVLVREGATTRDVVLGVIQGRRLAARMSQNGDGVLTNSSDDNSGDAGEQRGARQEEVEGECERWADGCIERVMAAMAEAGWDTERVLIRSTMAQFRAEIAQ